MSVTKEELAEWQHAGERAFPGMVSIQTNLAQTSAPYAAFERTYHPFFHTFINMKKEMK